jgi:hypothetical protein
MGGGALKKEQLVAKALAGAWRAVPPAFDLNEVELAVVTPLLLGSGAGSLGWWRVRGSSFRENESAAQLQDAYRMHALLNRAHEERIARTLRAFRLLGIEPLLVKGRAIAACYPEPWLRPYGDLDLCVLPQQYQEARRIVADLPPTDRTFIDLHHGLDQLWFDGEVSAQETEAVFARSVTCAIGDTIARVPSPTDHLRLLCLHFLKHGGWRPLWLCDIAAIVEAHEGEFDWEICLGADARQGRKIVCVIKLCEELLGARLSVRVARAWRDKAVPSWLKKTVLKQWRMPFATRHEGGDLMRDSLRHPRQFWTALSKRWTQCDAIRATQAFDADFNRFPRLPWRLVFAAHRTFDFVRREARAPLRRIGAR